MSDELGGPQREAAPPSADPLSHPEHPAHTQNWISIGALVVAVLSAFFSWLTYQNSSAELRQNEESFFMRERIQQCIMLTSAAFAFANEADQVAQRRLSDAERFRLVRARTAEIINSARLTYLGPSLLAEAELRVITAVGDVTQVFRDAVTGGDLNRLGLNNALARVDEEIMSFQSDCSQAIGAYGHGPNDRKPGKTVFKLRIEQQRWSGRGQTYVGAQASTEN